MNLRCIYQGIILLILIFISINISIAQVKLTDRVVELIEMTGLDYYTPVESFYQSVPVIGNDYIDYDLGVAAKEVNLEIRYAFRPVTGQQSDMFPNITAMATASSVATNHEDEEMRVRVIDPETLSNTYNADWGAVIDLVPKIKFSEAQNCKMLAIYAEGKGSVYVFFLYDELSQFLKDQIRSLKFKE